MRPAAGAARVVGTCYVCRLPVRAVHKAYVRDGELDLTMGLGVRRLVHRGECEHTLRTRLGFAP